MDFDYDLFVIGAGPGGTAAAQRAATHGARVAIAERDRVGGNCVIHGCVPEKMMTYAARFSDLLKNADEYGWNKVSQQFDWSEFMRSRDKNIDHLSQVHKDHLKVAGVELIKGEAAFLDLHTIQVGDRKVSADKILIAVGASSIVPDIPGIEHAITMRDLLALQQPPDHLAIIGSNHIATKFAGILNELICKVTQVVQEDYVLPDCDQDLRIAVQTGMTQQGIRFFCNTRVKSIEKVKNGFNLMLAGGTEDTKLVDTVAYVTERTANISTLNLNAAGVDVHQGMVAINDDNCTSQPHIFAVGDCTHRLQWTPVAIAQGRAFADTKFGGTPTTVSYEGIPYAVSTKPEAATVGMSEAEARKKLGDAVSTYHKTFQPLFNLIGESEEEAMLKLVVDKNTDQVLGAHMVGESAAEVIQMLAPGLKAGVTKQHFDSSLGIHPSVSEEFFTLR